MKIVNRIKPIGGSLLAALIVPLESPLCEAANANTTPIATSPPTLSQKPSQPPLMLAKRYPHNTPVAFESNRYWVSEKLDGVRAYWNGRQLLSRQGYPIQAPAWFTQALPNQPLDGELWIGRGKFDQVSAAVRRYQPDEQQWRQIRFVLFDLPASPLPFEQRYRLLQQLNNQIAQPHIQVIRHQRVDSTDQLMQSLQQYLNQGAEGLMLNLGSAHYQPGRSSALLKLKTFFDAEARVVGHLPGKGQFEGMLGSLLVEKPDGTRFRIGSGFSHEQRRQPPAIGSLISYKYAGLTRQGKPRFASFLRLREDQPPPPE